MLLAIIEYQSSKKLKTVILQASARSNGNTQKIAQLLAAEINADIIILNEYDIAAYDYEHSHTDDDFLKVMRQIVSYDRIIMATPVYWYSMSAQLKIFLDRITDCLKIEKDLGRLLKGKSLAALSCGSDDYEVLGFFEPFKLSAEYLHMSYIGDIHTWIEQEVSELVMDKIKSFALQIANHAGQSTQ